MCTERETLSQSHTPAASADTHHSRPAVTVQTHEIVTPEDPVDDVSFKAYKTKLRLALSLKTNAVALHGTSCSRHAGSMCWEYFTDNVIYVKLLLSL